MMTKSRYQRIMIGFSLAAIVVSCKTAPQTRSRGGSNSAGSSSSGGGGATSGEWETPLNLVNITDPVQQATKVLLTGEIERITLDNPLDVFTSGVIEMSGMRVIVPANLIIQMPVQRYTLQELFTNARPECILKKQTGLALSDDCFFERRGATATIQANRSGTGAVIAGDVVIEKAAEFVTGVVTYIDHNAGYFILNGRTDPIQTVVGRALVSNAANIALRKSTGVMVRINDPEARHTLQSGLGCEAATRNCTPDKRFPVDSDNYTVGFITGYPLCIPSTVRTTLRTSAVTFPATGTTASVLSGIDPKCPSTNRPANPATTDVADSRFFAPIVVGDQLDAKGSFERINGVTFLSAHTIKVHAGLQTTAGKPDYLIFSETIWEVAGFPRARARGAWLGFSTDRNSQFDLFRLAIDPTNATEPVDPTDPNEKSRQHLIPLGSTVNNPSTFNLGVPPNNTSIFRIRFKDLFAVGAAGRLSPCLHIDNANDTGLLPGGCASGGTLDASENFKVLSPATREILALSRNNRGAPGKPKIKSFDIGGLEAPNGRYLAPVGIDHPDFVEVNLNRLQTPFLFTGIPWALDRRLGPQGCGGTRGACDAAAPLKPFPGDGGMDPTQQNVAGFNLPQDVGNRMVMSYPYTNTTDGPVFDWLALDQSSKNAIVASKPVVLNVCTAN